VQFVVVLTVDEIAVGVLILAADVRTLLVDVADVVRLGQVAALVLDVDVPIAVLDEDGDVLVAEVPSDVVEIVDFSWPFSDPSAVQQLPTLEKRATISQGRCPVKRDARPARRGLRSSFSGGGFGPQGGASVPARLRVVHLGTDSPGICVS
jgi:hypothetical protein